MADFRTEITADRAQYDATMDAAAAKAMTTGQAMSSAMRESSVKMLASLKEANAGMNAHFDGIKDAVTSIRGAFAAVTAVLAGGALFKKTIEGTREMVAEVLLLSRMLGVTAREASALRSALNVNGIEAESYTTMIGKLTMKLRENEERFNELGAVTRGSNRELLNGQVIMQNTLQALLKFKEGTDRNLAATEFFGKGWNEVVKLFKVTPEAIEEARQRVEALQMEIGPEGVARARAYGVMWKELKETGEALGNRIGQALMPILTELGNFFGIFGPAAVVVMRGAIGGLSAVFWGLAMAVVTSFQLAKAALFTIIEPLAAIAEASGLALQGKWSEAGERLKSVGKNTEAAWRASFEGIMKQGDKTRKELAALFDPNAEQGQSPKSQGGKDYAGKDDGKSRASQWDAELAAQRDAYDRMKLEAGSFQQYTKEMESAFWKRKLELTKEGTVERAEVEKKYYAVEREVRKQAFDAQVADIKRQMAAAATNAEQRIALANRIYTLEVQRHKAGSKEAIAALQEVQKEYDAWAKQQRELRDLLAKSERDHQLSSLELERANLETLEQLGQITHRQHLEALRKLKESEYQIEAKALEDKKALMAEDPSTDPVKYQELLNQIRAAKEKHSLDMAKIDGQIQVESFKVWRQIGDAITSSFSTAIKGVIMGTQTLTQAMRNMAQSVFLALLDMGVKWIAQSIVNALIGKAIDKTAKMGEIGNAAALAAANTFASISAIPIVGPAMAPGAAAAAYAEGMAWQGALLAAAGGFDVPHGVNPITQLHQEEMVLPANIANPLREAVEGGGMGGDAYHFHALDVKSVRDFVMGNRAVFAEAAQRHARETYGPRGR